MKTTRPELALERILVALERELINTADEEVLAAAKELGMNPAMKGSAAFFGVTLLVRPIGTDLGGSRLKETSEQKDAPLRRRRPKGDAPTST
jgi:hypothetical protein